MGFTRPRPALPRPLPQSKPSGPLEEPSLSSISCTVSAACPCDFNTSGVSLCLFRAVALEGALLPFFQIDLKNRRSAEVGLAGRGSHCRLRGPARSLRALLASVPSRSPHPSRPGVGEQFRAQACPRAEARSPAQRLGLGRDRETQLSNPRPGRRGRWGADRPDAQAERTPARSQAAPGPMLRGAG